MNESMSRLRAQHVWSQVAGARVSSELATVSKDLPMLIRNHGLAIAVAMTRDRSRRGDRGAGSRQVQHGDLLRWLEDWLLRKCRMRPFTGSYRDLLEACVQADRASYLAAQGEALAYLQQVKLILCALQEDT